MKSAFSPRPRYEDYTDGTLRERAAAYLADRWEYLCQYDLMLPQKIARRTYFTANTYHVIRNMRDREGQFPD